MAEVGQSELPEKKHGGAIVRCRSINLVTEETEMLLTVVYSYRASPLSSLTMPRHAFEPTGTIDLFSPVCVVLGSGCAPKI